MSEWVGGEVGRDRQMGGRGREGRGWCWVRIWLGAETEIGGKIASKKGGISCAFFEVRYSCPFGPHARGICGYMWCG